MIFCENLNYNVCNTPCRILYSDNREFSGEPHGCVLLNTVLTKICQFCKYHTWYFFLLAGSSFGQFSCSWRVKLSFCVKGCLHLAQKYLCTPFRILPYRTLELPTVPGPEPKTRTFWPPIFMICWGPPTAEAPGVISCDIWAAVSGIICPDVEGLSAVDDEVAAWPSTVELTVVELGGVGWISATTVELVDCSTLTGSPRSGGVLTVAVGVVEAVDIGTSLVKWRPSMAGPSFCRVHVNP